MIANCFVVESSALFVHVAYCVIKDVQSAGLLSNNNDTQVDELKYDDILCCASVGSAACYKVAEQSSSRSLTAGQQSRPPMPCVLASLSERKTSGYGKAK